MTQKTREKMTKEVAKNAWDNKLYWQFFFFFTTSILPKENLRTLTGKTKQEFNKSFFVRHI